MELGMRLRVLSRREIRALTDRLMLFLRAFGLLKGLAALGAPAFRGVVHDTFEHQRDHLALGHPVEPAQLNELLGFSIIARQA